MVGLQRAGSKARKLRVQIQVPLLKEQLDATNEGTEGEETEDTTVGLGARPAVQCHLPTV